MRASDETDLETVSRPVTRRGALVLLGGLGLAVAGCSGGDDSSSATATTKGAGSSTTTTSTGTTATTSGATAAVTSCSVIPEETAGPFPADGSNGVDVLSENGSCARTSATSFDGASGTAEGVPYTIQFTVVDIANNCKPLTGAAVYVWHCDRDGNYSMYSQAATDQNYLRGRAGSRRQRARVLHQHLPRLLLRSLAPRALRGVPERRRGDEWGHEVGHVADRAPAGRVHRGVRDHWLRTERPQPLAGVARVRHGVLRRRRRSRHRR